MRPALLAVGCRRASLKNIDDDKGARCGISLEWPFDFLETFSAWNLVDRNHAKDRRKEKSLCQMARHIFVNNYIYISNQAHI